MTKRHTETKAYVKTALTTLLTEQSFETLTVSDLTKKAGINRGTFYLHYTDKFDMMNHFKNDTLDDLYRLLNQAEIYTDARQVLNQTLSYLIEHREFITALATISYLKFPQLIKDFCYQFLTTITGFQDIVTNQYHIPYPYALEVYLASIESIISYWIANGYQETTEEVADIILKAVTLDN
ncbi:bacterial regulatory s, tetR family protein [Streptococcus pyogenes]|nr:bacterial regulatory s, tetR family protein [Streptococcus pyogenes]